MIIVIAVFVLAFLIISPFITTIITSLVLSYLFYPLYLKLKKKLKKNWLASVLICIIIVLIVIIPFIVIINSLATQAIDVYSTASKYLETRNQTLSQFYETIEEKTGVGINLKGMLLSLKDIVVGKTGVFIGELPDKILKFFIMIFLIYYFLKDGEKMAAKAKSMIPINKGAKDKILKGSKDLTNAVIYGSLLTAMIQGIIGGIGFAIFGVGSPIFWGFIMAIFALIPLLGTAIVWVPAAIILFAKGIFLNDPWIIGKGIGLFIYGLFLVSTIDNFIKPKLIGDKVNLHPAIVLLGILGGLKFIGFIGILIGPIILAMFIAIIKIYSDEYGV